MFMHAVYTLLAIFFFTGHWAWGEIVPFSIAAVADPQYAETQARGGRQPAEGVARLGHAVTTWNQRDLDWGVILGDLIDWDDIDYGQFPGKTVTQAPQEWAHARAILDTWRKLKVPGYVVLGNHDYYVPYADADGLKKPASVYRAYGFKDKAYYNFRHKGFHFIVLDGDFNYLNFDPGLPQYQAARDYYNAFSGPEKQWWNAAISVRQRIWLMDLLDRSLNLDEPVVIMCHYPIHKPLDGHSLMNGAEMLSLLEGYPNVVLWMNGHKHGGAYAQEGRRHHLNLKGMQNGGKNWYQIDFTADRITAYQAEDTTTPVYNLDITRPQPTLPVPENVQLSAAEDLVKLTWDKEPEGVTGVVIERRHILSAEPWKTLKIVGVPGNQRVEDLPEKALVEYAYRIRFSDGGEGSAYSKAIRFDPANQP